VLHNGNGASVFNGANDDASGLAVLAGIADGFATQGVRPRRSIVFAAFFGEELGQLGSQFYTRHPLVPLQDTIADINLEQLGRPDSSDGLNIGQFNATGFGYTTLTAVFQRAAEAVGITLKNDELRGDAYYLRSDNRAFAEVGIPSHTFSVAYEFPDYHKPSDKWQKLDYENMAKVGRAIASGVWNAANSVASPEWLSTSETAPFRRSRHSPTN
jgi:Zn-dependent M28 family amino/carboxypeptidase